MACPAFQIHQGYLAPHPLQIGEMVGFSFPATLGFVAVSPPSYKLVPNHCLTL